MDPREHSSRSVAWGFQWLQSFVSRIKASLHWRLSLESSQGQFLVTRGEGQGGYRHVYIGRSPLSVVIVISILFGFQRRSFGFCSSIPRTFRTPR